MSRHKNSSAAALAALASNLEQVRELALRLGPYLILLLLPGGSLLALATLLYQRRNRLLIIENKHG
jgi:hypothetical protein